MKLLNKILIVIFILLSVFFHIMIKDDHTISRIVEAFDRSINIITDIGNEEDKIASIKKVAKENNINILTIKKEPRESIRNIPIINIYLDINDAERFKEKISFFHLDSSENKIDEIRLLTNKEINFKSFEELKGKNISGDYFVSGNNKSIDNFLEALNSIGINVNKSNVNFAGDLYMNDVLIFILFLLILFIAVIFSIVIKSSKMVRELGVAQLLGVDAFKYGMFKTLKSLGIVYAMSIIITSIGVYMYTEVMSVVGFVRVISSELVLVTIIAILLFFIESITIYTILKKINIISIIKGKNLQYRRAMYFFKSVAIAITIYMLTLSILGLIEHIKMKEEISNWDKLKNYGNIGFTWSEDYMEHNDKFERIVQPHLISLADKLDEKGAILFDAPYLINKEVIDEEQLDKEFFEGDYAYINKNYINKFDIYDAENKTIKVDDIKRNEWIVLIPENINLSEKETLKLRELHKTKCRKNDNLNEKILKYKKEQKVLSMDNLLDVRKSEVAEYAIILVNPKEMRFNDFLSNNLINGKLHPYIDNPSFPVETIMPLVKEANAEDYIVDIQSIFGHIAEIIERHKLEMFVDFIGGFLSLIVLVVVMKLDSENYFYKEGKRIYVSRLLGYGFKDIHYMKISQNMIGYISSIAFLIVIIIITKILRIDILVPYEDWNISNTLVLFIVSVVVFVICYLLDNKMYRKYENDLIRMLKEEC